MLSKYVMVGGKNLVPNVTAIEIHVDTSVNVEPMCFLEKSERILSNNLIPMVSVQWSLWMSWMQLRSKKKMLFGIFPICFKLVLRFVIFLRLVH